jgi:hypothetical protein
MKMVSVARKLSMIERRKEQHCLFGRRDYRTKVTNPKSVLGLSLGEDVGFTDNNLSVIFKEKYRMIWPMISFRAINIDNKCKYQSNFPSVTLRTLCYFDI